MQAAIGSLALDTARATGAGEREIELGQQVRVVDGYSHRFYVVSQGKCGMDGYPHRFHVVPQAPRQISTPKLAEYVQKSHVLNKFLGVLFV